MHKHQTALVRALLGFIGKQSACPAFSNATIEHNRIRFWIDSGSIEVLVSCDDIADTKGLRGVIPAALLKQYLAGTKEVDLSTFTVKGDKDKYLTKVLIKPDHGNFVVGGDDSDQPLIFASFDDDKSVAELLAGGREAIVASSKVASTDATRAYVNAVWLKGDTIRATDGHKLEKRAFQGNASELVGIPLAVCKVLAKLGGDPKITITRGRHGGTKNTCQLTIPANGAVVRFSWPDIDAQPPPMEAFEASLPAFPIAIDVNRDQLKGIVKGFKHPMVSFWPDGSMVAHESGINDATYDPAVASFLPNGVLTTDPVWIVGPTNLPLPDGEMAIAADRQHARIGSRIVMGCRSHPRKNDVPFRTDLPVSVQEQLALQWELAELIPVKRVASEHEIVKLEAEFDELKNRPAWSVGKRLAEIKDELIIKLRKAECGFRRHDGHGGYLDMSLVFCGRAGLTERFGGTFYGLHGLRHEKRDGSVYVIDQRVGEIYNYTPSALENSCPAIQVAAVEKGRMFGGQFEIGHQITKHITPVASPTETFTMTRETILPQLPDPEPIDEAPDTIRDRECIPDSGVRPTEQKLVPYKREVSARVAEIAQTLGVRKPSLYTVGLHKVTKEQFAHMFRSVGASEIVFIGAVTPMVKRVLGSMVSTVDAGHALTTVTRALTNGQTVILAGSAVSPWGDGRHGVALATIEAGYAAYHLVPTDDSIIEAREFQHSIDEDREWNGEALSEYLVEQAEVRAA